MIHKRALLLMLGAALFCEVQYYLVVEKQEVIRACLVPPAAAELATLAGFRHGQGVATNF